MNDTQIEVKVIANGQSKSVVFDTPTAAEVQQLREQVRTFDAANFWQANQIKALTRDNELTRKQLAETRDGLAPVRERLIRAEYNEKTFRDAYWALNDQMTERNRAEWVRYKVVNNETKYRMEERISRIPGVGTGTTKNWKEYTSGLVKFTRAAN